MHRLQTDQEEGISMATRVHEVPPGGSEAAGNGRASDAQGSEREEAEASSLYKVPSLCGWANDGAAPTHPRRREVHPLP